MDSFFLLYRVCTFISYTPKVNDVVQFHYLTKDERSVNLFALSHLSLTYRSHLLNAGENDFMDLLRKDIADMEKYMIDHRNEGKCGVLYLVAEDIIAFLRLCEGPLLDNEVKSGDAASTNCPATHLRRNPKFYLGLINVFRLTPL